MPQWLKDTIATILFIAIFVAIVATFLIALSLFGGHARAHDSWINKEGFVDPVSKQSCCGDHDCKVVPGDMVSRVPEGYYLKLTGETIPYERALESRDGQFWRCENLAGINTGKTRCFFKVDPGM